jgi:hypothetical protein
MENEKVEKCQEMNLIVVVAPRFSGLSLAQQCFGWQNSDRSSDDHKFF